MNSTNKPAMFLNCCADGKHCHSVGADGIELVM